jgi:hypothetical protein
VVAAPARELLLEAANRSQEGASGRVWRALAGPLVHATWDHLVRDVALTAIVGAGATAFRMDLGEGVRQLPLAHAAGLAVGAAFAAGYAVLRCAFEAEMRRT